MKKFIISCFIAFCLLSGLNAEEGFKNEAGIRAGFFNGMTFRYVIKDKFGIETILDSRWRGFEIIGLYEIYKHAFNTERLNWYFGAGGHVGIFNGNYVTWGTHGTSYEVIGIDGIAGLEYSFRKIPLSIGLYWKPAFSVFGYSGIWADDGAISIRYIF